MTIAHIAYAKRSDGHGGGVPLFGHYLARCLGAREWAWADYDVDDKRSYRGEPAAAEALGKWLEASGKLDGVDAVVADGFWARGIEPAGIPVFSVAHGTWRGIARACGSPNAARLGDVQAGEYERRMTVAVSAHVERELRELYAVRTTATIRNGVDAEEFRPRVNGVRDRLVVIYPSDAWPKGGDVVAALKERMGGFEFRRIGAGIGGEAAAIAEGDIYLHPSRSDGNSYAALQAMACGLPMVASATGLFADMRGGALDGFGIGACVERVGAEPDAVATWEAALLGVAGARRECGEAARAWIEEYATLERWTEQWRRLLATYA